MILYWPHETDLNTPSLDQYTPYLLKKLSSLVRLRAKARVCSEPVRSLIKREYTRQFFALYNGGCPWVEGQYQFTKIVRELGYLAPDSTVLQPGQKISDTALLKEVAQLDQESNVRLCKPLYDSRGRGLHLAQTPEEAIAFAKSQGRPYLVQSFMPPQLGEQRYILHRTAVDLAEGQGPSVRIAVTKLGPTIIGNGQFTIKELIHAKKQWSRRDVNKLTMAAPDRVPMQGERVQLVNSGNCSAKLHEFALPPQAELEKVDAIMLEFLAAFEDKIGGILATMCVDIGFSSEGLIFYELQFPFGHPYGRSYDGTGRQPGQRSKLMQSMWYGGIFNSRR